MIVNFFKKNSFIEKSIFFLIFLFICSLVSGPFLPDLFISLIAFFFLYYFIKDFRLFIKNKIIKIFFIFYLYIVFISLFSEVPIESLKTSISFGLE